MGIKYFVAVIIALFLLTSCTYEKVEVAEPAEDSTFVCDTSAITYTKDIQPLMLLHCGTNDACHRTDDNQSDVPLDTYEWASFFAQNENQLLNSIVSQNGEDPKMPKDGDKLSECDINKIKAWINQGMVQ